MNIVFRLIANRWVPTIISIFFLAPELFDFKNDMNLGRVIIHLLICTLCLLGICFINGLMVKTAMLFNLIFFGIFPIYEINSGVLYWDSKITNHEFMSASIWVLIYTCCIYCGIFLGKKLFKRRAIVDKIYKFKQYQLISYILIAGFLLLYAFDFNFESLMTKNQYVDNVDSKQGALFIEFFVRPLIFYLCLILLFLNRAFLPKILLVAVIFICISPTGITRFLVAALYLPGIIMLCSKKLSRDAVEYLYINLILIGILVVFPILDIFRFFSVEKLYSFQFNSEIFQAGDFDAFQMFANTMGLERISYGYGFLGVILFFIPRDWWPSKPLNSGVEISSDLGLRNTNVSMPAVAELYLNFSYIGIVIGAVILGIFLVKIDSIFKNIRGNNPLLIFIYCEIAALIFFNFRGGLLSTYAASVAILSGWVFIGIILKRRCG